MPPTSFDMDNLDSWDGVHHTRDDDDAGGLPEDAQELYHRLTREGAPSRDRLARIDQRLQERIAQLSATQIAVTPEPEAESEPHATTNGFRGGAPRSYASEPSMRRAPRHAAAHRWATLLATAAVVIAFVVVLTVSAGQRTAGRPVSHQTPTVAASPTSASTSASWADLTRLDYSTNFAGNGFPAIAPSDPQVVYETMAYDAHGTQQIPAELRATTDGGVTWRMLPTPVPADHIGAADIVVSPLNPQTIFLDLFDTVVADCPPTSAVNSGAGLPSNCDIQYSSFDGGAHWTLTAPTLPVAYGSRSGELTAGISSGMPAGFGIPIQADALGAQGQRLYSGAIYTCSNAPGDASCIRLVASDDGGHTWRFADLPLLADGAANVCDYAASLSSVDLYAVTAPASCDFRQQAARTLWHSVDGGATWAKVRQLATPNEAGLALAQDATTGAPLLYLAEPVTTSFTKDKIGDNIPTLSQAPSDVKVSTDGGATWQSAPTRGIPSDHAAFFGPGLLGPLSDGSIVIEAIPPSTTDPRGGLSSDNFQGSDLYTWKPGDSDWHPIGSVTEEMDGLLVVPAPSGDGDTIYAFLTSRNDTNTYTILRKHVAP